MKSPNSGCVLLETWLTRSSHSLALFSSQEHHPFILDQERDKNGLYESGVNRWALRGVTVLCQKWPGGFVYMCVAVTLIVEACSGEAAGLFSRPPPHSSTPLIHSTSYNELRMFASQKSVNDSKWTSRWKNDELAYLCWWTATGRRTCGESERERKREH